jgi:hypothetical protein
MKESSSQIVYSIAVHPHGTLFQRMETAPVFETGAVFYSIMQKRTRITPFVLHPPEASTEGKRGYCF